jgi:serine/threonine protein phosphatase PrpC
MRIINTLAAAASTDPGRQRDVNEDRCHVDVARGVFAVIDGVGGQAAGGKAADVALAMLRTRLERETGAVADRVREAIAIANNEIHRLAALRPEWNGMACVLTVAVVEDGRATIGHVGDTRLYKVRHDRIEKVTRDHSPVGEREDANDLTETEAMRHPRRNEVYRDVGSEPHQPDDHEFVDVQQIAFEPDAALLLCSDGLSDLVHSASIVKVVRRFAGDPDAVVRALVASANEAGGKDNITAVYLEGEEFAASQAARASLEAIEPRGGDVDRIHSTGTEPGRERRVSRGRAVRVGILALLLVVLGLSLVLAPGRAWPFLSSVHSAFDSIPTIFNAIPSIAVVPATGDQVVQPTESIAAAIERAAPGSAVIVEPGEYREQLVLRDRIRVVSRVPRGAVIRLPATAPEAEAAVLADGLSAAELVGFRIVGDAATPLGVGLLVRNSSLSILDVEITGATKVAVDVAQGAGVSLVGSEIRDNPGAALAIRAGAAPRIAHGWFARNGTSEQAATLIIEAGASPVFHRNVFQGTPPDVFAGLDQRARDAVKRDNWFPRPESATPVPAAAHPRTRR